MSFHSISLSLGGVITKIYFTVRKANGKKWKGTMLRKLTFGYIYIYIHKKPYLSFYSLNFSLYIYSLLFSHFKVFEY